MSEDNKTKKIAILALMFAILAIGLSESTSTTTTGVQYVLNTTNLAPSVAGESIGTGERVADNRTYWANNSALFISVFAHANTTGDNSEIHLYINGTKYQDQSGKPIGVAEQNNKSIAHIIPQYSYYSVEVHNAHHYVWLETRILTGNVTTISGTGGVANHSLLSNLQGGVPASDEFYHLNLSHYNYIEGLVNCVGTPDNYYPLSFVSGFTCLTIPRHDNDKVNKGGDTMTGTLNMSNNNITNINYTITKHGIISKTLNESPIIPDDAKGTGTDYLVQITTENNSPTMVFNSFGNFANGFSAIRYNGTPESYEALGENAIIFSVGARGSNGHNTFSATKAAMFLSTSSSWNTTSNPTKIDFSTTNIGSTARTTRLVINDSGQVEIKTLSRGLSVTEGANAKQGTCTMIAGACLVSNTAITATSRLFYNYQAPCSTSIGTIYEIGRNASANFTLRNTNGANACTIAYEIFEPS